MPNTNNLKALEDEFEYNFGFVHFLLYFNSIVILHVLWSFYASLPKIKTKSFPIDP